MTHAAHGAYCELALPGLDVPDPTGTHRPRAG
jgi:hypothetical protein